MQDGATIIPTTNYINDLRLLSWLIKEFSDSWFTIKEAHERIKNNQKITFEQMEEHCSILSNEFFLIPGINKDESKYKLRLKFLSEEETLRS